MKTLTEILKALGTGNVRVNNRFDTQALKDAFYSLKPPYGSIYLTTPVPTVIGTPGVYTKCLGTTAYASTPHFMEMDANNRLTYTGDKMRHFHIAVTISMTAAQNNQVVGFRIAKNDTALSEAQIRRKISTGIDIGSTALHADLHLSQGDYIEIWGTNYTTASNIQLEDMYFFAMGMIH